MATENIYKSLSHLLDGGDKVAVATIVQVKGSVPREVGAKMIVHPLGRHVGTIGGGCGEADVIRAGIDSMTSGEARIVQIDLTEDISMQALGVCGGIFDVFVEPVGSDTLAGSVTAAQRLAALQESIAARRPVALVKVIRGSQSGREMVLWLDSPPLGDLALPSELESRVIEDARQVLRLRQHRILRYPGTNAELFVEVQRRAPELLIVGAGHIALPLAQLASICDFSVIVLDDRPSFANQGRFPTARQVIAAPLRETVRALPLDEDSFVVLVTRGHSQDVECLLDVIDRPVAYIGMIGSPRRVDAVFKLLTEEMGFDPLKFDRVHAPIGLDIAAQTPAEIAVCIMAEIINALRGGPALGLSEKRRNRDQARRLRKEQQAHH